MLNCPKCKSKNIDQYRKPTGKIWCQDCGFSSPAKEKFNPFEMPEKDLILPFDRWFRRLLVVNTNHHEFGLNYPLGSCCYRDVLRHEKVKEALKIAWKEIIEKETL